MLTAIRTILWPDAWLDRLRSEERRLDRGFRRALRRRVHMPDSRPNWGWRDLLPLRRPAAEVIEIERPRRMPPLSEAAAAKSVESAVSALLGEAGIRARDEVGRHIDTLPRGRERAEKFSPLVIAHRIRTERVIETEICRELRASGEPVPAIDYRRRLVGEMRALEAELSSERRAETFDPLTEQELAVRQGQLMLVRLLLDMDNARADLQRRRHARPAGSESSTTSDGGHAAPQRAPSIDLGMEL